MRVLVTGASGLIGRALVTRLRARGAEVVRLVRRQPRAADEASWDPARGLDPGAAAGTDAVVHLAGEGIASGRWSAARKARIRDSRVRGTRALAESLARAEPPPRVLVSASAVGFYGDRGEEPVDETSAPGTGFLPDLARDWEAAAAPAVAAGIRVVHPRLGLVLSPAGGVLGRLLPIFRLGLGGPIGRGRAWWSWITLTDVIGVIVLALDRADLGGPVNAVAPHPVRNREFARALGRVLGRPAVLPVPPFALRLGFGEMADEALLAGTRVEPARLAEVGFRFQHPHLEPALRTLLTPVPDGSARA